MNTNYDVVIIGAGPAGLTAAIYAGRANLRVLIIERGLYGGQMNNTADIDNYPGFASVLGPELGEKMHASAMQFKPDYLTAEVKEVQLVGASKRVVTDQGTLTSPIVIAAAGSEHKHLNKPGEEEFSGRGVSYCAVCDAGFFKDEDVIVIGGGDSAVEEGIYLAQLAKSVTIVHRRDQLRAQQILQQRAFRNKKINFIWNADVQEIEGDGQKVTGICYRDKVTGAEKHLPGRGVFIYVGLAPQTKPFAKLGVTDDAGWLKTDESLQTKVPGLFAAGDVRAKHLRQIATAVGEGSLAGQEAYEYWQQLQDHKA